MASAASSSSAEKSGPSHYQGSKWHAFFVGTRYRNIKLALKPAIALAIVMAIGQSTPVATIEGSTMYLSAIFSTLFMPNKPRILTLELTLIAAILFAAVVPYGMLGFLCIRATRDPVRDAQQIAQYTAALARGDQLAAGPAVFYQGRAAAVAALFLFGLSWMANTAKTLFPHIIFCITSSSIICGVFFLESYLFPTWAQWYTTAKQVLYCCYIGLAVSFGVSLFIFPYNAREPYLALTGNFLDMVDKMTSDQAKQFSEIHLGRRERDKLSAPASQTNDASGTDTSGTRSDTSEKASKHASELAEIAKLQGMRNALAAISTAQEAAKVLAKREIAIGHMRASEFEAMHKLCKTLILPVMGCNLWAQVVLIMRRDKETSTGEDDAGITFLESLSTRTDLSPEVEEELFALMEEQIAPRIRSLSAFCTDAVIHIKRVLHLGIYSRPSFFLRLFISSPAPIAEDDMNFSDCFEAEIATFWANKHINGTKAFASQEDDRPHAASLLICFMESTMHGMAMRLLEFCRWADEQRSTGIMTSRRLIVPKPKRYTKALRQRFSQVSSQFHDKNEGKNGSASDADMLGHDESMESKSSNIDASKAFLAPSKPNLLSRPGITFGVLAFFYRAKIFLFDSQVSGFGLRAAVAMTAGALPAYFPDSVAFFLKYRLIWVAFTVLLGLQPVLGRGIAALGFRMIGTVVGGVAGLVVLEVGRVPGGVIPVFFLTLLPQFYLLQLKPKETMLPVLLSVITENLVVGYELVAGKLGVAAVERSGQEYLQAPAVMGYRILLTFAGVVIVLIFSICPSLPAARNMLQQTVAKRFQVASDMYLLSTIRGQSDRFELPSNIEKAISQKRIEALALSSASHDLLGVTKFELSVRGKFPQAEWAKLLSLIDNFMTALTVTDVLFTLMENSDPNNYLAAVRPKLHGTVEDSIRITSASLFALNSAFDQWRPLSPMLRSPVAAHKETQTNIMALSTLIMTEGTKGTISADLVTHFSARIIAKAMMSRYLEEILQQTSILVGHSGFKTYLQAHRRPSKAE